MTLNILLVDDEVLMRSFMRTLIVWEKYGMTICGEAEDGQTAIGKIEELQPDIVIADVHMPYMDGVQLSAAIAARFPEVSLIMVSGFDTFDYVRETLRNGAADYLLKHKLNDKTLLNVLLAIRESKERERLARDEQDAIRKQRDAESPVLASSYLRNLLLRTARFEPDGGFPYLPASSADAGWALLAVQVMNHEIVTARLKDTEVTMHTLTVQDLLRQAMGDETAGCVTYLEKGRYVLLLNCPAFRGEYALTQHLDAVRHRISSSLLNFLGLRTNIMTSPCFRNLRSIAEEYDSTAGRLDRLIGLQSGQSCEAAGGTPDLSITIRDEKRLLAAVEVRDKTAAARVIEEIYDRARHANDFERQRVTVELIHSAGKVGMKTGVETAWLNRAVLQGSRSERTAVEYCALIKQIYGRLIDSISARLGSRVYSPYVERAVERIQRAYMHSLSLEETAAAIGITPSYLSRLFKEETGKPFTEFLNGYRIEISKKLIEAGNSKINELYRQVGFNNYSYFIKVFKELTGDTPYAYVRKMHMSKK